MTKAKGQITPKVAATLLFCLTLLSGSLSLTPLIWNDSTSFIASMISTLETGAPQAKNGVSIGYVLVLSGIYKLGGALKSLIFLQQIGWATTVALCTLVLWQWVSYKKIMLVWLLLLAAYPGIQIYQNIVLAESLYVSALTSALCLLLLAQAPQPDGKPIPLLLGALLLSLSAALLKIQGVAPFVAIAACVLFIAARTSRRAVQVCAAGVVGTIAVLIAGQQLRTGSNDATAVLFGPKTMFCAHLDIVLTAASTAELANGAFGNRASAFLDLLQRDLASKDGSFPTLGFNSDACQFDRELDQLGIASQTKGVQGLADWYRQAFAAAVIEQPVSYGQKFAKQLAYGLRMAVPPHGLGRSSGSVDERRILTIDMLTSAKLDAHALQQPKLLQVPILSRLEVPTNYGSRLLSLAAGASLCWAFAGMTLSSWRGNRLAPPVAMAALVWFAQIGTTAAAHTLDVWRYIVPVVPAALIVLAFVADAGWAKWKSGNRWTPRGNT